MGTILSSKILPDDRVKLRICLNEEEALSLGGCVKNVHVFSSDLCKYESRVIERGRDGVTKHFLVPSNLRDKTKRLFFGIKCQKIDMGNKDLYVYVLSRERNILF
ncbi:MAG: hypothetical protein KAK00_02090 [Nanoarchaeota archaeon]|nr:hypothetical protein [Nanoarchaeota archaeon]